MTIALFPNAPRLAVQLSRFANPQELVNPHFPGSDEVVAELQREMSQLPSNAPLTNRVWVVSEFVRTHISYAPDWDLFGGNLHDWPTPEEVWLQRSDDCDGIAILTASLLQRLGMNATLDYNAFHCWVRVAPAAGDPESMHITSGGAIAGPMASRADGGVDWVRLGQDLLRTRTWVEGFTFPLWRVLVALAAAALPWLALWRLPLWLGRRLVLRSTGRTSEAGDLSRAAVAINEVVVAAVGGPRLVPARTPTDEEIRRKYVEAVGNGGDGLSRTEGWRERM